MISLHIILSQHPSMTSTINRLNSEVLRQTTQLLMGISLNNFTFTFFLLGKSVQIISLSLFFFSFVYVCVRSNMKKQFAKIQKLISSFREWIDVGLLFELLFDVVFIKRVTLFKNICHRRVQSNLKRGFSRTSIERKDRCGHHCGGHPSLGGIEDSIHKKMLK